MKVRFSGGTKNINREVSLDKKCTCTPCKPIKAKEEEKVVVKEEKKETEKKEVISPIEFDESLIKKGNKKSKKEMLMEHLDAIKELLKNNSEEENGVLEKCIRSSLKSVMDKAMEPVKQQLHTIDTLDKKIEEMKSEFDKEWTIEELLEKAQEVAVRNQLSLSTLMIDDIDGFMTDVFPVILEKAIETKYIDLFIDVNNLDLRWNESDYAIVAKVKSGIRFNNINSLDTDTLDKEFDIPILSEDIQEVLEKNSSLTIIETEDIDDFNVKKSEDDEEKVYEDFRFFSSKVVNAKEILPDQEPCRVLVLLDSEGNYLTYKDSTDIIAIDEIDDRSVGGLSIVSRAWLRGKLEEIGEKKKEDDQLPTGVIPPDISVNGVPTSDEEE